MVFYNNAEAKIMYTKMTIYPQLDYYTHRLCGLCGKMVQVLKINACNCA